MNALAPAEVRELSVPEWPAQFVCSTTVPRQRSPAAHTAAGRRAALDALARAGCAIIEMPPRAGRLPVWPTGFVGSIAHDDALAIAIVARTEITKAIGIDVERYDGLSVHEAAVVLSDDELAFAAHDSSIATLLWSAKESAYKAWCGGLGQDLDRVDPLDVHVTASGAGALHLRAVGALVERVATIGALQGRWVRVGDSVITLAWA